MYFHDSVGSLDYFVFDEADSGPGAGEPVSPGIRCAVFPDDADTLYPLRRPEKYPSFFVPERMDVNYFYGEHSFPVAEFLELVPVCEVMEIQKVCHLKILSRSNVGMPELFCRLSGCVWVVCY